MEKYPVLVNGWNLEYEENMTYYKVFGKRVEAICLMWIDTARGNDGYNEEGDAWIGISADGSTLADTEEMLDIMPFEITEVGRRTEVEKLMFKYMKEH